MNEPNAFCGLKKGDMKSAQKDRDAMTHVIQNIRKKNEKKSEKGVSQSENK